MALPGKYERLIDCPECMGESSYYDPILKAHTIVCPNCVGEGTICGECYRNVDSCRGEGTCWEHDEDGTFDPTESYD